MALAENQLTWLDFAKAPVRQHLEGKRLPDFTVVADPGYALGSIQ
jgi:hypothetical protein